MTTPLLHHREVQVGARSVDLFEPEGPFTGVEVDAFRQCVLDLAAGGHREFKLGFGAMTRMDSTALGVLISIHSRLEDLRGRLVIDFQGNRRIRDLFALTKMDTVFRVDRGDGDPDATTVRRL